jgi:hypothetical protein
VCAEKPEVNVMLNLETTTVRTLEERILKVSSLWASELLQDIER